MESEFREIARDSHAVEKVSMLPTVIGAFTCLFLMYPMNAQETRKVGPAHVLAMWLCSAVNRKVVWKMKVLSNDIAKQNNNEDGVFFQKPMMWGLISLCKTKYHSQITELHGCVLSNDFFSSYTDET